MGNSSHFTMKDRRRSRNIAPALAASIIFQNWFLLIITTSQSDLKEETQLSNKFEKILR